MTHLRGNDADLHHPDGTHRSTPVSTRGRALEAHERRLGKHLTLHAETEHYEIDIHWEPMENWVLGHWKPFDTKEQAQHFLDVLQAHPGYDHTQVNTRIVRVRGEQRKIVKTYLVKKPSSRID